MKKGGLVAVFLGLFLILLIGMASAISNPSAVYCEGLGYGYEIDDTGVGICVVSNNVRLDAWNFLEGKIGERYSYCAKKGYSTESIRDGKNSFSEEYSSCITDNSAKKSGNEIVTDLMNFSERLNSSTFHIDKKPASKFSFIFRMFLSVLRRSFGTLTGNAVDSFTVKIPEYFDWRNYNGNWMTPVKNQGSCGSCWAFAILGDMESKIKIRRNDSKFDADLSEQDLVSCGVPYGFYPGSGGCKGADFEAPLDYLNNTGVTDEACFSYSASDESCLNKCASSDKRIWKINNYDYASLTKQEIKTHLISNGPVMAGIYMAGSFVDGIYTCSNPGSNLNHAVIIVGYNETGKYWSVRNSWGSNWNGDGYFKVGYGKCNIENYLMYLDLEINSTEKINIESSEVSVGEQEGKYDYLFFKDNLSMKYNEICDNSTCGGYEVRNVFSLRSFPKIISLDLISYQNSSDEKETDFNYWNQKENSWESLGNIRKNSYLVKYNFCDSSEECSAYFSEDNVFLEYSHVKKENSSADFSSVDWLYLEAQATECFDNWVLNSTWTACRINDVQYKNYYDLNDCYKNVSYFDMNLSQPCDYCTPNVTQFNESCSLNNTFFSGYSDSRNCFSTTGLQSDTVLNNQTFICDYCLPNWTENKICNSDNSSTIWYNDSENCFLITGLVSDLAGMPVNQTLISSCNYTTNSSENNSTNNNSTNNVTEYCGDGTCNNGETCSTCAGDCGGCPSGGSGGGGGGGGSFVVNSPIVTEVVETPEAETNVDNNPEQESPVLSSTGEMINTKEESKKQFSLTGLMVSMQNNSSLKIAFASVFFVALCVGGFFFLRNSKFSKKYIHKNIVRIHRKRKSLK